MTDTCPHCSVSLQGEPIPQEYIDKGYYGPGVTHYRREIGVEVAGVYDGVLYWRCPDCNMAWPRDFGHTSVRTLDSLTYAIRHNDRKGVVA